MSTYKLSLKAIRRYVEDNIGSFHEARLRSLRELELKQILKRKNPYLFKAKHVIAAPELVKLLLDAHLSSQEETMFGDFLEGLAIHVCKLAYGGKKSSRTSIDLEFERDGVFLYRLNKIGAELGER
jgi:hypothetical protein